MIEVFKTNVTEQSQASWLVNLIHQYFIDHEANFDLLDCDNILRIKCLSGNIDPSHLILFLKEQGYYAEVLV